MAPPSTAFMITGGSLPASSSMAANSASCWGRRQRCNRRTVGGTGDTKGRPSGLGPQKRNLNDADDCLLGTRRCEQVFDLALRHGDDRGVIRVGVRLGNTVVLEYPSVGSEGLGWTPVGPDGDPESATGTQHPQHFRNDGISVRHELQTLLTVDGIDDSIGQGEMVGRALKGFHRGQVISCLQSNSGEHERADVGGDHPSARTDDGCRRVRHRTCSRRDVQYRVPERRGHESQELPSPRIEHRRLQVVPIAVRDGGEVEQTWLGFAHWPKLPLAPAPLRRDRVPPAATSELGMSSDVIVKVGHPLPVKVLDRDSPSVHRLRPFLVFS